MIKMIMRLVWLLQMEPPIVEHLLLLYTACLPNMVVMAPFDEAELMHMVATASVVDDRQTQLLQVSKGNGIGAALPFNNKGTPPENNVRRMQSCCFGIQFYSSTMSTSSKYAEKQRHLCDSS
ncbi:uncharacterized protein LOC126708857 isoform X2 [Quercus robur]|uniref:uncharacterized protein LOC126708857 isoform X2 n=1 Tax=Quercus robur TaxID=38942 RepID=UPI0021614DFE|nr:uncharacterized protein LOC126708857 isoform X2 [Quercus robur]